MNIQKQQNQPQQENRNVPYWNEREWLQSFMEASQSGDYDALHSLRIEVFKHTIECVEAGAQTTMPNKEELAKLTKFYDQEILPENYTQCYDTMIDVVNEDSFVAAKMLIDKGFTPAVLNMASSHNPGGGVINGAGAQEESLFRRSNLFCSLYQFASYAYKYGIKKSQHQYPLDRYWGGIYSPKVFVFKGTEKQGYPLLDRPYCVDVITVPAINRPELDCNGMIVSNLVETTKNKMRTIFRMALANANDSLVLGAFGCGAFRNPPRHIASIFHKVIDEEEFKGKFREICFAIIDDHNAKLRHNPQGNYLPFKNEFNK